MYSQAMQCKKWYLSVLFLLTVLITACDSDSEFSSPKPIKDTTPPTIVSFYPDESVASGFEVDFDIEIIFSERMNLASLENEGGIRLFSGLNEVSTSPDTDINAELKPRDSLFIFSEVPLTGKDLITGKEIVIEGTKVTMRPPSGRFALNTAYTVTVNEPARDLVEDDTATSEDDRNYIQGGNFYDFITEKGTWKSVKQLPNIQVFVDTSDNNTEKALVESKNQFSPLIVSNKQGDTVGIWRQESDIAGINQLWISRYLIPSKKWALLNPNKNICLEVSSSQCANAERIDAINETDVLEYHAAINDSGQMAVVWTKAAQVGEYISVFANLYDGENWLGSVDISDTGFLKTGNADSPQVGIDKSGNVVAIWREHDGSAARIKTRLFKLAATDPLMGNGAWISTPTFIDTAVGSTTESPKLAINTNGLAMALWSQDVSGNLRIFSNRIRLSQNDSWQTPVQLDVIASNSPEFGIGDSTLPDISIGENGDAFAVWLKHDGVRNNLWYNRFTGNWGTLASRLEANRLGDAGYPQVEITDDKEVLVVWTQKINDTNLTELYSRYFTPSKGWTAEKLITSSSQIHKPVLRVDREGNANLLWQNGLNKGSVLTSYYSSLNATWDSVLTLADNGNNPALAPLSDDGRFLAIWEKIDDLDYRLNFTRYSD